MIEAWEKPAPNAEIVQRGELPCRTCGKIHHARALTKPRWGTWADPDDGHVYNQYTWEEMGRRIVDEFKVDLERLAAS